MKPDPTTGSPPMPTIVELPRPSWVSSWPIWYVSVPDRLDEPDPALAEDLGRDDPDVCLPRRERAGAVGAEHRDSLRPDVVVNPQHLVGREPLRDADHGPDPGVNGLVDGIRREARGDEDHGRVRAGLVHCLGDSVEDRHAVDVRTALPGRDACDDVRAVVAVANPVERALPAGEPLDDEPRVVVDDDRH